MLGMVFLQKALPQLPLMGEEFKAVMKSIDGLTKVFGKAEEEAKSTMPAEVMNIMSQQQGPGAAPGAGKTPAGAPPPAPTMQ